MCWTASSPTDANMQDRRLADSAETRPLQSQALPTKRLRDQRATSPTRMRLQSPAPL